MQVTLSSSSEHYKQVPLFRLNSVLKHPGRRDEEDEEPERQQWDKYDDDDDESDGDDDGNGNDDDGDDDDDDPMITLIKSPLPAQSSSCFPAFQCQSDSATSGDFLLLLMKM